MEKNLYTVNEKFNNLRLDVFLSEKTGISRSQIKKMIDEKLVLVNEKKEKAGYLLRTSDCITVYIKKEEDLVAQNIDIDIIYEDDYIAVINKQQDLVIHPGAGNMDNTLVNALLYHFDTLAEGSQSDRPGIVHRLDKDTSGLVIIAKTQDAYLNLVRDFKNHKINKSYLAFVHGSLISNGSIDAPIGRNENNRLKMAVKRNNSKEAYTEYRILKNYDNYTLLNVSILTGRTHQIRVHMAYINHPIVGDLLYGYKNKYKIEKQMLHAYSLEFNHPITEEKMNFKTKFPERFTKFIKKIEG